MLKICPGIGHIVPAMNYEPCSDQGYLYSGTVVGSSEHHSIPNCFPQTC